MLSSLEGGVVGSELGLEGTAGLRPRARNCWWSRLGRVGKAGAGWGSRVEEVKLRR